MSACEFLQRPDDAVVALNAEGKMTQAQLRERVAQYRAALTDQPGGSWGLYLEDTFEFGCAWMALHAEGKHIVVLPNAQEGFLADRASSLQGWVLDAPGPGGLPAVTPGALDPSIRADRNLPDSFDDMVLAFFTSGSTGEGKAVTKTWDQLAAEVAVLEEVWGSRAESSAVLSSVTHQHIYGFLFHFLWPLMQGRPFWVGSLVFPDRLQSALQAVDQAVLISCPAHLQRMVDLIDLEVLRDRCVMMFSSGGLLESAHAHRVEAVWKEPPVEVFGSTETGGVAYRQQRAAENDVPWTCLPQVDIRLSGSDGILEVKSPFATVDAEQSTDGWCRMGDKAVLLGDRTFRSLGREDRVVKIEQKRVSLNDMEQRLAEHPDVKQSRVVLLPAEGEYQRARLGAVVVMQDGDEPEQEIKRRLKKHLAKFFEAVTLPRRWRIVDALPENRMGKSAKADILKLFDDAPKDSRVWLPDVLDEKQEGARVELFCRVPDNLCFFEGHFDEQPIVAGVVQIHWAMHIAKTRFGVSPGSREFRHIKFYQLLLPQDEFSLSVSYEAEKKEVKFCLTGQEKEFSSGCVVVPG